MKKHILCFGDSNTHGYFPSPSHGNDGELYRFNENERYTCLLQKALGDDYLVIEEGLSGRTTVFDDPFMDGLSGLRYLFPCLKSHEPISLLIIMLGTNDTKARFSVGAPEIGMGIARLIRTAQATDCWGPNGKPNILVIAPPPILEGRNSVKNDTMGPGCVEKSRQLADIYEAHCEALGVHFLNASDAGCVFNNCDFMHLTKDSHRLLAEKLADLIPSILSE